jgi:predicted dehydrogenase
MAGDAMAIRVGVIGMGFMGTMYARVLARLEGAVLAGVCDVLPMRAEEAGRAFGVPAYADAEALLERGDLQAVCICGPEDAHLAPAIVALERGVAALVEKPLATTLEDAQAIREAAARAGAILSVGHILRFDYRYAALREAVARGDIGAVQSLHARRWNTRSAQQRLRGRSSLPLFLGVHDYDLVRWIAGAEATRVVAESRSRVLRAEGYAVEDTTIALISLDNGALACVEAGWILPEGHPSGFVQRLDVLGAHGMLSLEGSGGGLTAIDDARATWPDTALWPGIGGAVGGALERQIRHFVSCVATGAQPLVRGEDGLAAVWIALAVEESARLGQSVAVGLQAPAPGRREPPALEHEDAGKGVERQARSS